MRLDGLLRAGLVLVAVSQGTGIVACLVSGNLLAVTVALTGLAMEVTMLCAVRWLRLWWLNWWRGWTLREEARASWNGQHSDAPRPTGSAPVA